MKKAICILFIIVFSNLVSAQNEPQKIFLSHLSVIEKFVNPKEGEVMLGDELDTAIEFLEKLTEIKSNLDYGHPILKEPTKKNFKSWGKWFKRHKKELYLDSENKVKFKSTKE